MGRHSELTPALWDVAPGIVLAVLMRSRSWIPPWPCRICCGITGGLWDLQALVRVGQDSQFPSFLTWLVPWVLYSIRHFALWFVKRGIIPELGFPCLSKFSWGIQGFGALSQPLCHAANRKFLAIIEYYFFYNSVLNKTQSSLSSGLVCKGVEPIFQWWILGKIWGFLAGKDVPFAFLLE